MPTLASRRIIPSDANTIGAILTDIGSLHEWNPALRSVATTDHAAFINHTYNVSTVLPGPADLTYIVMSKNLVVWRLNVLGGREIGEWELSDSPQGTLVVHRMTNSGLMFTAAARQMRNVPDLRLERLARRVATLP